MAPTAEMISRKQDLNANKAGLVETQGFIPWGPGFQNMLNGIRTALSREDLTVDINEVKKALTDYKSDPSDWKKFAKFSKHRYTRHLLDELEDKYNVMLLCWDDGTKSSIHDHSGSHCFMKVLDGEIVESRFSWPDENQNQNDVEFQHRNLIDQRVSGRNEALYIHDKVGLHRVENPNESQKAVSLHVYIPPFKECQTFDKKTGKARVSKLRFDTKLGDPAVGDNDFTKKL